MKHPHAAFIEELGGAPALSEHLGLKANATSNWLMRGVPWRWRVQVAQLARRKRKVLPDGFLAPVAAAADAAD